MNQLKLEWSDVYQLAGGLAKKIVDSNQITRHTVYGIPRGGIHAAQLVHAAAPGEILLTETPEEAEVFVDDIIQTGQTRTRYLAKYKKPFLALVNKPKEKIDDWVSFPWERMKHETAAQENITRILEAIGEKPNREGLLETPARVVKSWSKIYGGYDMNPAKVLKTFTEPSCTEMIILKDIEFYSTCEHHLLPFFGKAHIGYIPKNGKIVGVSKLVRLLEVFARRAQIQERIGQQVTDALMQHLNPIGCGCILEAQHLCMVARGVEKQNSQMVTSSLRGEFLHSPRISQEFMKAVGK